MSQPDKYDQHIVELLEVNSHGLRAAWLSAKGLFQMATPDGDSGDREDGKKCGCLTGIRYGDGLYAWTDELTDEIHNDDRLPECFNILEDAWDNMSVDDRRASLEIFAEWQRRLDEEIREVAA